MFRKDPFNEEPFEAHSDYDTTLETFDEYEGEPLDVFSEVDEEDGLFEEFENEPIDNLFEFDEGPEIFEAEMDTALESEVKRKSRAYVRWVQQSLNKILGTRLKVDGLIGRRTRNAIRAFQRRAGITVDGIAGRQTQRALIAAGAAPPSGIPSTGTRVTSQPQTVRKFHLDPLLGPVWVKPPLGMAAELPRVLEQQEEKEKEIIWPDQRRPVIDTTKVPYRWICHLDIDFGTARDPFNPGNLIYLISRGTGTLITPRHVLTAGHNILWNFPRLDGKTREALAIRVSPGYNCAAKRNATPFGSSNALPDRWRVSDEWRASFDHEFDFGLLRLTTALGSRPQPALGNRPLGFWGSRQWGKGTRINPRDPEGLRGRGINLSGYPGDKCCYKQFLDLATGKLLLDEVGNRLNCKDHSWAGAQFRAFGHVLGPPPRPGLIIHDADTYGGHSGSPIWLRWKNFYNLIAIHTGWYVRHVSNRGVLITADLLREVRSWI